MSDVWFSNDLIAQKSERELRDLLRYWARGQALAAAARQGGDVKQAPAESPQSGHEVATPKTHQGNSQ
jgi:hypothetical protein